MREITAIVQPPKGAKSNIVQPSRYERYELECKDTYFWTICKTL